MRDSRTTTIVSIIVSLLLTAIVIVTVSLAYGNTSSEYDVVLFGDSNLGNFRSATGPGRLFAKESKLKVLNAGIGGTLMNNTPSENCVEDPWRYYSMVELSKAVANKDFSIQKAEFPKYYIDFYNGNFDYLEGVLDELSKTDFSKVKTIYICLGLNDYLNGSRLSDPDNKYNEKTFAGALRTSIENLKSVAPNANIIIIAPNYNKVLGDSDTMSTGHGTLPDYIEQERQISEEYGLKFASLNDHITKENVDTYLYDGMHINDEGARVFADLLLETLN